MLYILARHGAGHRLSPSELNFRANIFGFKLLGVERILSASAVALAVALPALAAEITPQKLVSPEAGNWLMYRRTYDSWGYSPLERINTRNVGTLVPVWSASTGTTEGHQSPPIVNDGVMFITTPFNQVFAYDAKTGDLLWRYRRQMPPDIRMGHPTNRGVALYGDKVYMATSDAKVVALNAKTGAVVWDKAVADYNTGYYMTMAPLAARGKIMVGVSGGERAAQHIREGNPDGRGPEIKPNEPLPRRQEAGEFCNVIHNAGSRRFPGQAQFSPCHIPATRHRPLRCVLACR